MNNKKVYELVPMPGLELVREDYKTNLQYLRNLKRITQKDLSNRSGVNLSMIQFYEQGVKDINKAQAMTLYKIALVLETSIESLLEIKKEVEE